MKRIALAILSSAFAVPAMAQSSALTVGSPTQGQLSASSTVDPHRGCPSGTYTLSASAGEGYEVRVVSDEFDTYLVVTAPSGAVVEMNDDYEGALNSGVQFRAAESGDYLVYASSFGCAGAGLYQVSVTAVDASLLPDPSRPIQSAPIAYGTPVTGDLSVTDAIYHQRQSYADLYTFDGRAGDMIAASLESDAFDAYLVLLGPNGLEANSDDDGGEGVNSLLTHTLTETGTYRLMATSFSGQSTGGYTLSITDDYVPPIQTATPLAAGQTLRGALGGDHTFRVALEAGQPVEIAVQSSDFDTIVSIIEPAGSYSMASDDDGGEGTDSLLIFTPYATGEALVEVSSYAEVAVGSFSISMRNAVGNEIAPTRLRVGRPVSGTIDGSDPRSNTMGYSLDVYALALEPEDVVTVGLVGAPVDPFAYNPVTLRVMDPLGEQIYGTGSSYQTGSIAISAFHGGTYLVYVQSAELGTDYTLDVVEGRVALDLAEPIGGIEIGSEVTGTLSSDSGMYSPRNAPADIYTLVVEESAPVTIAMNSSFDTYLVLMDEAGSVVAENDDFDGLNSSITQTLAPGTYRVIATMFSAGAGDYSLRVGAGEFTSTVIHSVTVGQSQSVAVRRATGADEYGYAAAFFELNGTAGQELTIRASSEDSDTYLRLLDELGQEVASNDDADGGLDSRITITLPRDGRYTIVLRELSGLEADLTLDVQPGLDGEVTTPYLQVNYGYGSYESGEMGIDSAIMPHGGW